MNSPVNLRHSVRPTTPSGESSRAQSQKKPSPDDLADTVLLENLGQEKPKLPEQTFYRYELYFSLGNASSKNGHLILDHLPIQCQRTSPLRYGQKITLDFTRLMEGCDKKTKKAWDAVRQVHPEIERTTHQIIGYHAKNIFYIRPIGPAPKSNQSEFILNKKTPFPTTGLFINRYMKR